VTHDVSNGRDYCGDSDGGRDYDDTANVSVCDLSINESGDI
jgi:hypothetical protein